MAMVLSHSGLADLRCDADVGSDPAGTAEAPSSATAKRAVQAKYRGEFVDDGDLGSLDLPEDYEEYHDRPFFHPYD